ncbi:MAG TPA: ABC transporter permease, partial [Nitrosomonas europaea]|nr:ABC transporter permease [Nitrosomonas europaea]
MYKFQYDFSKMTLAFRNVIRHKRRSSFAIGAAAFGITALLLASGFIEWIYQDMRESTIHSQSGHLQIVKPGYSEAGKADPYHFLFSDDLEQDLLKNPTLQNHNHLIKTIVPRLSFSGLISHGDATLS